MQMCFGQALPPCPAPCWDNPLPATLSAGSRDCWDVPWLHPIRCYISWTRKHRRAKASTPYMSVCPQWAQSWSMPQRVVWGVPKSGFKPDHVFCRDGHLWAVRTKEGHNFKIVFIYSLFSFINTYIAIETRRAPWRRSKTGFMCLGRSSLCRQQGKLLNYRF